MLRWLVRALFTILFSGLTAASAVASVAWIPSQELDSFWGRFPSTTIGNVDWRPFQGLLYSNPRESIAVMERMKMAQTELSLFDRLEGIIQSMEAYVVLYETDRVATILKELDPYLTQLTVDQRIRYLSCVGTYLAIIGQPTQGIEKLNESIGLARQIADYDQLSKRLNDLAWVYLNMGKVENAMHATLEAEILSRRKRMSYEHGYSLMTLAGVHSAAGRAAQSLEFSQESLKILKALHYDFTVSMVLFNIMNTHTRNKNYREAIKVSDELIPLATALNDKSTVAYAYIALGHSWKAANDPEKAVQYYEKAMPAIQETHDVAAFTGIADNLLPLYLSLKKFGEASSILTEYDSIIRTAYADNIPYTVRVNQMRLKGEHQFATGQVTEAFLTFKNLSFEMGKKIRDLEMKSISSMGSEVELDLRNKQNEALKALAESQSESIAALQRVRNLFAVVLGLSGLLFLSLYRSHRKNTLIRQQKTNIDLILGTIGEGILRFEQDFKITSEHSRSAAQILNQGHDLTGMSFLQLLRRIEEAAVVKISDQVESTCQAIWGESSLYWELNEGNLPTQLTIDQKELKLSWHPLFIANKLTALVLVISDVTELMKSRRMQQDAYNKTSFLVNLIARVGHSLPKVLDQAARLKKFLSTHRDSLLAGDKGLLPQLHTFKGNLRTLSMTPLDARVHELESAVKENTRIAEGWHELEQDLDRYVEVSRYFESQTNTRKTSLLLSLNDSISPIFKRLDENNIPLEDFEIQFNLIDPQAQHLECLESFLLHGLNNALDHGFILPLQKAKGRTLAPARFHLVIHEDTQALHFTLNDNGAGIPLDLIEKRCKDRGIDTRSLPCLTSALFLPEFSTASEVSLTSGRGVGLAALKELASAHGGQISINNRAEGPGTTLRMTVPKPGAYEKVS